MGSFAGSVASGLPGFRLFGPFAGALGGSEPIEPSGSRDRTPLFSVVTRLR